MNRRLCPAVVGWLALSALLATSLIQAEPDAPRASSPAVRYVCVTFSDRSLEGDFSGGYVVSSVKGSFAVPDASSGRGVGLALGVRTGLLGVELGYRQTGHTVQCHERRSDAAWRGLGADARLYSPALGPVRTFLTVGVGLEWLSVDEGYCSDSTGFHCASRFEGMGYNVGPGLLVEINRRLFVTGRAVYQRTDFDTVDADEIGASTLPLAISGRGWAWITGLGVTF
ncbi:MAG TPA: hypothetical protein PKW75_04330 [candidate division Zixibacteria bacterium]|nr:hypothetical protein [candidate division Zixibacteria bacterium]MDD4918080.1 hypothetical protein [candidate division Zixibacteria bacterium]MDM7972051.1 hypothetical protein [candidate division Zixibacteria bacterium]HOZ07495.1 hypothetical protein [candidate division Zixibacteria bacterium]HPM37402.1 hypothetical protein [candidate division Zixibacteria bacterium]